MHRRDKIYYLLSLVKEKAEELLADEEFVKDDFTAEELFAVCTSIVLKQKVSIAYSSPIGRVDKSNIVFVIDKNIQIGISNQEDENENKD